MTGASPGSRPPPAAELDHLVVTAPDLEAGVAWVESALGVAPERGGEHPAMGTHNALLRLGSGVYLEVIAPNPAATPPRRPRMFELDRLAPGDPPRLATWVARTPDIRASAAGSLEALGEIQPLSRGVLRWLITIPPDGALPRGGMVPALIEWQVKQHPANALPDRGLRLERLEAFDPDPDGLAAALRSIRLDGAVAIRGAPSGAPPRLVARIRTPAGDRVLEGAA